MINLDEEQIIEGIINRDSATIQELIDRYSHKLKRTSYLILRDETLSEDVVQEAFVKLVYNINQFKGKSSLYTYLYKIVINECRQKLRTNWFKKVVLFDKENMVEDIEKNFEENKIDKMTIIGCIGKLNIKYREIITLYYYEDMSIYEICQITGEKEGTIKSRLKRARGLLKKILGEEGYDYER